MKTFPDPSNSPAHHTRHLRISVFLPDENAWIRSFQHVESLMVAFEAISRTSLIPLHGLSPTLKTLHMTHFSVPPSETFSLICSFPLLEHLTICRWTAENVNGEWVAPSTSPKFTRTLHLIEQIWPAAPLLLALPDGLHFTRIVLQCSVRDARFVMDLVSGCSDTLESLCVDYRFTCVSPFTPEVYHYLTAVS